MRTSALVVLAALALAVPAAPCRAAPQTEVVGARTDLADEPDPRRRVELVREQAALELDGPAAARRLDVLAELARDDPARDVRRAALEALAGLRERPCARALAELSLDLAPDEGALAATLLAAFPAGRSEAYARVQAAFADPRALAAVPPEVLAGWFAGYGRALAEAEGGGDRGRERAPFVLGAVHPAPAVRRAAAAALDQALRRLSELERDERSDRLLARLAGDGLDARDVLDLRVRSALAEGGVDPARALAGARAGARGGGDPWEDQRWRFRASYLEGLALLAQDRADESDAALRAAGDVLEGLLGRRVDRAGPGGAAEQAELLHARALVELARAATRLAQGTAGDDLAVLERLRRAHQLELEAQLVATRGDAPAPRSLAVLFDDPLAAQRLLFAERPHPAWPAERCLALELALGRGLASVSARELPGLEPYGELPASLADPLQDPWRADLLVELMRAELEADKRALAKLERRLLDAGDDARELEAQVMLLRLQVRRQERDLPQQASAVDLFDLRAPSDAALVLGERLRAQGRLDEARALGERTAADLVASNLPARLPKAVELQARAHLLVGGAWTDADEPARAEPEMLEALKLLEGLLTLCRERGWVQDARVVEAQVADALVSLAVNANVKGKDPEKALAYFERAYALQQNEFMSVLLACYRARSGRAEEARALIADVPESPRTYYNLACTHALLGDTARALELLERDFEENRASAAELERQKAWARSDPDLGALREDPRFEALTAPAAR